MSSSNKINLFKPSDLHSPKESPIVESLRAGVVIQVNSWLEKHIGPVVYAAIANVTWTDYRIETDTHRAHLFQIEPLATIGCEHNNLDYGSIHSAPCATCKDCGALLKPKWEVVK
jgi:hypothetical protein